ncbi:flagellar protein FliT [Luteimonas sp. FCS-9]|uniref:flagellar protein FliT n=1 Tax=Luteimonas sp. FCS-9 TaxID=1547516 RepID=UPI00069A22D4|nr:flagellar protein FliT [Luteimonas sp. FCS-9]
MSVLEALHRDLDALDAAIARDEFDAAAGLLAGYQQRLRGTIETLGARLPVEALRALLATQHALTARMRARRDAVAVQLRQVHRADAASRAYADVGHAP